MQRDWKELRLNGDDYYVPLSIRKGERKALSNVCRKLARAYRVTTALLAESRTL